MASTPHLKVPTTLPSSTRTRDLAFRTRRRPAVATVASYENGSLTGGGGGAAAAPGRLRVAYQGAPGAYSEFAAKTASPDCTTLPFRTFGGAVAAVESGAADRAILPVESTMEGTALRNYDLLLCHDLHVVQEINLFVHYCLLALPGVAASHLRRVISHPVALAHCGRALSRLGSVELEPVDDTAGAVEMLRSGRLLDTAAIASPRAASLYGLQVLAHGLQDESWNVTRFLILARRQINGHKINGHNHETHSHQYNTSQQKTSIVVAHRGGSMMFLLKVLSVFSSLNINLTKLEVNNPSAEGKGPVMVLDVNGGRCLRSFPHVLYVDFEGSTDDPKVKEAVDEIAKFSVLVRVLGCYAADTNVYDLH